MTTQEALAPIKHNEHDCAVCMDIDLADYYLKAATSWKARVALQRLAQLLRIWHEEAV